MTRLSSVVQTYAVIALVLSALTVSPSASATPRMSLFAGAPCSTCHFSPQGGGLRTSIGWRAASRRGALSYEDVGIESFPPDSNTYFDDRITVGGNARLQLVRLGKPEEKIVRKNGEKRLEAKLPPRRLIPMQLEPGVAAKLRDYVTLTGSYNINRGTFKGKPCDTVFDGQSCYEATAIFEPSPKYPTFTVGMFQPTFGIRYDDHTRLTKDDASEGRRELIPPNYAEPTAEVHYNPVSWLQTDASIFRPQNLEKSYGNRRVVSEDDVGYSARVTYKPKVEWSLDLSFYGLFGSSIFGAGDFQMYNGFAGVGWIDHAGLMAEAAYLDLDPVKSRESINSSLSAWYKVNDWLHLFGRLERSKTGDPKNLWVKHTALIGTHFYPIPFFEIRPEYRYSSRRDWELAQYTVQFHLFY